MPRVPVEALHGVGHQQVDERARGWIALQVFEDLLPAGGREVGINAGGEAVGRGESVAVRLPVLAEVAR